MSVLASHHQLRLTRPGVVGPRAGNRATARRAVTAPACKASSPNDANEEDHSRANPVVGTLIAGIVALTAVGPTDAALAKTKAPVTATEPSTELNAAAVSLYFLFVWAIRLTFVLFTALRQGVRVQPSESGTPRQRSVAGQSNRPYGRRTQEDGAKVIRQFSRL